MALIDDNDYQCDAINVPVADKVGAGDTFVAECIVELLDGLDPHQRLDTVERIRALACGVPGDWKGMPRRGELAMLEQSEPVARYEVSILGVSRADRQSSSCSGSSSGARAQLSTYCTAPRIPDSTRGCGTGDRV